MKSILSLLVSIGCISALVVGVSASVWSPVQSTGSASAQAQAQGPESSGDLSTPETQHVSTFYQESDNFWLSWSRPADVSQSPANKAVWPVVATADGQRVYLAWTDGRDEPDNIYYAISDDAGWNWSPAQQVWPTDLKSQRPTLVVAGTIPFIAWADEYVKQQDRHHTTYQMTLGAGSPIIVPNERSLFASVSRLAVGIEGELHMVLQGGLPDSLTDILYSHRSIEATAWPTTTAIVTDTAGFAFNPDIAVSADGQTIHLVWQDASGVFYRPGQWNGQDVAWPSPPHRLARSEGITLSVRPDIAVGAGAIHVAWGEQVGEGINKYNEQYVRYSRLGDGETEWSPPIRIDPDLVAANADAPTDVAPALALTPSGAVCIAWHGFRPGPFPYEEIYLSCSTDQGASWETPLNVSRSSRSEVMSIRPTLAIGSDGILHLAWQELAGIEPKSDYQVYYAHSFPYSVMLPIIRR